VGASVEDCVTFLLAVERYPAWHPGVVRSAEIVERGEDGVPTRARAELHIAYGPIVKDFRLNLAVRVPRPGTVALTRIPHDARDPEEFAVKWTVTDGTRIHLDVDANLSVPRFLPVGGIGDALAQGFVDAAARAIRNP
jgi:polyketide cyclase/dehydrase/lipid transport protein